MQWSPPGVTGRGSFACLEHSEQEHLIWLREGIHCNDKRKVQTPKLCFPETKLSANAFA
jgi:hypothetical protein